MIRAMDPRLSDLANHPGFPDEVRLDYVQCVNRAIDHVIRNLDGSLHPEEVARAAGFSPFHIHRVFKSLVGETLDQFVKRQRQQLERARDARVRHAFMILLRLPAEVQPVFEERVRAAFPDRAHRILNAVRDMRGGAMNHSNFGERMSGSGPRWEATQRLSEIQCTRLGLRETRDMPYPDQIRTLLPGAMTAPVQPSLFD